MASRSTSSRPPTGSAANPVRRNLFQGHHLTRRVPTGASSSAAAAAVAATGGATSAPSNHSTEETQHNNHDSDIITRDHNGEPDCYMPDLQMQVITEEERRAGGYGEDGSYGEKERLDEQLLATYKSRSFVAADKAEILNAVQASLRRKVAALDEDNWMFEAEDPKHR
ncbi:MAG: hypothetical protein Q9183_000311 [Haloplaca sp. 2 TL-2023]